MHQGETDITGTGAMRTRASLPGLQIDIVHWHAAEGDSERLSIDIKAVPSFEAVARAFEAANPLALWVHGAQFAWSSWLQAASVLMLPWLPASPPRTISDAASRPALDRSTSE